MAESAERQLSHLCVAYQEVTASVRRSRTATQATIDVYGARATGLMHTEDTGQLAVPSTDPRVMCNDSNTWQLPVKAEIINQPHTAFPNYTGLDTARHSLICLR